MFWKIKYIIDTGYDWKHKLCVINAESKKSALDIFDSEIRYKLVGESYVISDSIAVEQCKNDVILYNGCY